MVIIPEDFGDNLGDMIPATVELITDQANTTAERENRRARRALQAYSQQIAAMRLTVCWFAVYLLH